MKQIKLALAAALVLFSISSAHAVQVSAKLALVIDVSGSVDSSEYSLMMNGYKAAFNDATVQSKISNLSNGLGVGVFFFASGAAGVYLESHLTNATDAGNFANAIGALARPGSIGSSTNIGGGMAAGINWLLNDTSFTSSSLVMDVSGDGTDNYLTTGSGAPEYQKAVATNNGITVNGIIIDPTSSLTSEYNNNVVTSDGFLISAASFNDFEDAVTDKIKTEIINAPEPMTVALLGLGLAALGFRRRV